MKTCYFPDFLHIPYEGQEGQIDLCATKLWIKASVLSFIGSPTSKSQFHLKKL